MVQVEKKEDRSPGDHLPIGKVKSEIISYILSKNDAVPATDLIKHLREKYGIRNKKNINNHLNELKANNCIEKIDPLRDGFENKWNITKIKTLKNIMSLFPEIRLNKYEKTVNIVLKKFNFAIVPVREKKAFVQLSLSISFFEKCLDTDIETLCARASKIPQLNEYINREGQNEEDIERLTHEAYLEFMERIHKISDIWPITNDEFIRYSVNFDVYQNTPQYFQNSSMSEEKFKRMLEEIKDPLEEKDLDGVIQRVIKELSMKVSHEIFSKRLAELSEESLQNQEVLNKMSDEIFEKLMEKNPIDLPMKICEIIDTRFQKMSTIFDKIFDHFYQRDVMDGSDSDEEQKFVSEMNKITSFKISEIKRVEDIDEKIDHFYEDYYEKCRKNGNYMK